jgi:hypothetical protein
MANRRSFGAGGMKASKPVSFNSSGGGNSLLNMMMAQSMLGEKQNTMNQAAVEKQGLTTQAAVPQAMGAVEKIGSPQGKPFIPPGTVFKTDVATSPGNRETTVDESKALSGSDMIMRHINYIKSEMDTNPRFGDIYNKATFRVGASGNKGQVAGFPLWFGDKDAAKLNFAIQDLSNRLLYLRSGAQTNEGEFRRLSATLPSWSHIQGMGGDTSVLKKMLDDYSFDAQNIKQRIIQGGNYEVMPAYHVELPQGFLEVNGLKAAQLDEMLKSEMDQATGVSGPPPKSPESPVSPIPGMAEQTGQADPLDEWRKEYLKP